MKRKKGSWLPASYTVEAAIAVPLLLALILFSVVMAFLLHDRAVLQAETVERAYGENGEKTILFVAKSPRFSEEEKGWEKEWIGTARYQGISLPILQIRSEEKSMEIRWTRKKLSMPAFIRFLGLLPHIEEQEEP